MHDENGNGVYFEQADVDTSYDGSNAYEYRAVELALGTDEYVHGRTTYVISYTAHNVVRAFVDSGNDELYWDINGTEWAQPFGRVSVALHLDGSLVGALTGAMACYSGSYSSTTPCEIVQGDDGTLSAIANDLGPYSNLTIAVGFEGGTFVQPDLPQQSWIITRAPAVLLLVALGLLVIALVVRFGLWRDSAGRGIIIPQYTVPEDRDLLAAGDLIEREDAALAAQFVDLAVRGFVQVVDLHPEGAVDGGSDRFALDFVTKDGATAAELKILNILFDELDEPGERKQLGSLAASVGAALYEQRPKARRATIKRGLREQPRGSIGVWIQRLGLLGLAGFAAIFAWTLFVEIDAGPMIGFAIASGVIQAIRSSILTKPFVLSSAGAEERDYLLGVRDYLQLAEADRLRVLQSPQGAERVASTDQRAIVALHEKLLPYAVLWGVEKQWARQLEVDYAAGAVSPSWVSSDLSSLDLGRMLTNFSSSSTSSVRPIVSSSSSSGGGGGGGGR